MQQNVGQVINKGIELADGKIDGIGGYGQGGDGYGSYAGTGYGSGYDSGPGASYGGAGGLYGRGGYGSSSRYHPYAR